MAAPLRNPGSPLRVRRCGSGGTDCRDSPFGNSLFFILLLTLIVTLYDHFEPVHGVRFQNVGRTRLGALRLALGRPGA